MILAACNRHPSEYSLTERKRGKKKTAEILP